MPAGSAGPRERVGANTWAGNCHWAMGALEGLRPFAPELLELAQNCEKAAVEARVSL